uniref:Variant surface glycoprotein 1125.1159 n=1 Tax=Trypanosoma brucei TaxID=5691 RepID=A0A1J0R6N2_9TRYP|nr:variant surface glycoprotein 1125.1159 [Trypanosoma brucei]
MEHRTSLLVLAVLLVVAVPADAADPAAGDSQQAFLSLCQTWAAAKAALAAPIEALAEPSEFQDIVNYNMTVSEDAWRQKVKEIVDAGGWDKYVVGKEKTYAGLGWETKWTKWQTAHQATEKPGQGWMTNKQTISDEQQRALKSIELNKTAAQAEQMLLLATATPKTPEGGDLQAELHAAAQKAMCGSETYAWDEKASKCKDVTATPTKAATCTNAAAGKALGLDMVCLCAAGAEACGSSLKGKVISGRNLQNNAIAELTAECPDAVTAGPLDRQIEDALNSVRTNIGLRVLTAPKPILGHRHETAADCQAADSAACVDYSNYYKKDNGGFETIPWVQQLRKAAQLYRSYSEQKLKAQQHMDALKHLALKAELEYDAKNLITSSPTEQRPEGGKAKRMEVTNRCTTKNQTAEQCPPDHCDYDGSKEECKPKSGTKNTAAGTGETARNAEGKKCTDKETEGDCKDGCMQV